MMKWKKKVFCQKQALITQELLWSLCLTPLIMTPGRVKIANKNEILL